MSVVEKLYQAYQTNTPLKLGELYLMTKQKLIRFKMRCCNLKKKQGKS